VLREFGGAFKYCLGWPGCYGWPMVSGGAVSRFAVQRYRTRLLVARLSMGLPSPFQLVNLALAIVGAWSVAYQAGMLLAGDRTAFGLLPAAGVAVAGAVAVVWLRLARRPQELFRSAAQSERRAEALRRSMAEGLKHDFAYEILARLYAPAVEQVRQLLPSTQVDWPADTNGRRCLVVTIAPAAPQRLDSLIIGLEEPRGVEWTTRASRFASERQAFMATLRRSVSLANKFGDEDGANIVLGRISAAPAVAMTVNIATYGQIVRTSDSLVNEFAAFADLASRSAWRRRPRPLRFRGDDVLKVLPWRRQVHAWDDLAALLVAPRGRACGLGVSLALVDDRSAGASVFVARRSSSVGTYPDVLHVVPSGMMNVHGDARHDPVQLAKLPRLAMMAEFLEECFDIDELSGHAVGNFAKRVERQIEDMRLGHLEPAFTGLAIDLLNLRTEVCGVLDLSGADAIVDAFTLCWEYTHTEQLRRIDLRAATAAVCRTGFVQSGIGSVHLASQWLAARPGSATHRP